MRQIIRAGVVVLLLAAPVQAQPMPTEPPKGEPPKSQRWNEEDFDAKARMTRPYNMVPSRDPALADTMIGSVRQ